MNGSWTYCITSLSLGAVVYVDIVRGLNGTFGAIERKETEKQR